MKIIKLFQFKFILILFLSFFSSVFCWIDRKPHRPIKPQIQQVVSVNPKLQNTTEEKPVQIKPKPTQIQLKPTQAKPQNSIVHQAESSLESQIQPSVSNLPEWTMIVYVQANNNLAKYAIKNFEAMSLIGSNNKLKILVQWYDSNHRGIWRYRIDKGKMELIENKSVNMDGNKSSDLVECVRWGVQNYPAQKYFLILWNHGVGILDPLWGNTRFSVDAEILHQSPKIQIQDLTIKNFDFNSLIETMGEEQRGILFNEMSRTYMTNQELKKALSEIKNNVLKRKIDLLGMDACLMAMLEVGYQIKDYVNYFVASEEVEVASGWPYTTFLRPLAKGGFSPYSLAQNIVNTYENLYKSKVSFYTQSAVDLQKMEELKISLDLVVESIRECKKHNVNLVKKIVKQSRSSCLRFSTPSYIDLHSFFVELLKNINTETTKAANKNCEQYLVTLKDSINLAQELMDEVVIANSVGTAVARAGGMSIYYPSGKIDSSYQKTDFAKNSLWADFLKEFSN